MQHNQLAWVQEFTHTVLGIEKEMIHKNWFSSYF